MDGIKTIALQLGFSDCKVASAAPPEHGWRLEDWLAEGCHASMEWIANNQAKRLNPHLILPNAKSIIVVSYDYWTSGCRTHGKIAQYAHGVDYHKIVEDKLADLAETLSQLGGEQRIYVDTGPILERDAAVAAGLGWCGKSNLLIRARAGSYCVLGVVVTSLELAVDSPMKDRCGLCTRCIDACPSGALQAHNLDARRCLSYWTIEHKGSVPEEMRYLIGDRLYGCDDCVQVCPWNRRAQEARDLRFSMSRALRDISLRELLRIDEAAFIALTPNSPIRRVKREGLIRNACIVLGNTGSLEDAPYLERLLQDSPLLAEHAAWAIKEIKSR